MLSFEYHANSEKNTSASIGGSSSGRVRRLTARNPYYCCGKMSGMWDGLRESEPLSPYDAASWPAGGSQGRRDEIHCALNSATSEAAL